MVLGIFDACLVNKNGLFIIDLLEYIKKIFCNLEKVKKIYEKFEKI